MIHPDTSFPIRAPASDSQEDARVREWLGRTLD